MQDRHQTLDVLRGVAVLGILLMNIVAMGMPGYAYVNPLLYGYESSADLAYWTIDFVLIEGKMRALFTMLFGASMALIAERATASGQDAVAVHYRRMAWLFVFGMIHAWLIWYGDILVQYALAGVIGFLMWRLPPRGLWIVFVLGILAQAALGFAHYGYLAAIRDAALASGATPDAVAAWRDIIAAEVPTPAMLADEVSGYLGGFTSAFATRAPTTLFFQTVFTPLGQPETWALMALGILTFRNGYLLGVRPRGEYRFFMIAGLLVGLPLSAWLAHGLISTRFDIAARALADVIGLLVRPLQLLGYVAIIVLCAQRFGTNWLVQRLAAAGRMALSNYLGSSIVATTIFYGYGLGWFGQLARHQLLVVVALIWVLILIWSKPWLDRYRYGPLEWLWRSLARAEMQPLRRV